MKQVKVLGCDPTGEIKDMCPLCHLATDDEPNFCSHPNGGKLKMFSTPSTYKDMFGNIIPAQNCRIETPVNCPLKSEDLKLAFNPDTVCPKCGGDSWKFNAVQSDVVL
jgi:hypothetical protein